MFGFLPSLYDSSRVMRSIIQSQGIEVDRLYQALDETLNQYFVNTATWGLAIWEYELGIETDEKKPIAQRRSVIISKIRGIGSVTVQLIKSVAESYDGGKVDVTVDHPNYTFTIKFVDTKGIPPNLDDLKAAIEEIKPAHMAVEYKFTYNTWAQVKTKTWGQLRTLTWEQIKGSIF